MSCPISGSINRARKRRGLWALLWAASLTSTAFGATPGSLWTGQIRCSGNLLNGGPAYAQSLSMTLEDGTGSARIEDAHTIERFELRRIGADRIRIDSEGQWKSFPDRRWITRTEGQIHAESLRTEGAMRASDGQTLVRERCTIALTRTPLPAASPSGGPGTASPAPAMEAFPVESAGAPSAQPLSTHSAAAQYPGIAAVFPEWLMESGQPWAFRATPAGTPRPLSTRPPAGRERDLFNEARHLVATRAIKAMVFVDGNAVAFAVGRPGLTATSVLPSASISKTVTAVGVGKALCSGRLSLDAPLGSVISRLRGTPIGSATLRDALSMASGGSVASHGITPAETAFHFAGSGSLIELVSSTRLTQTNAPPGSSFSYKSLDPYLAALATQEATGEPFTRLLQDTVLREIPVAQEVILDTDRSGNFLATGGVRMSLADWVRFALYVRDQRATSGCFAGYLKAMSQTQLRIRKIPGVNGYFNGYGYFTWVDNDAAPDSFWAVGHFGQRIGWSSRPGNPRVFLTFGFESDGDMAQIYALAHRWLNP